MDWLNHPLTKHPLTIILVVAVLLGAGYYLLSPVQQCMRDWENNREDWRKGGIYNDTRALKACQDRKGSW